MLICNHIQRREERDKCSELDRIQQELTYPGDMVEQRIFDRILEMCVPVCFDGKSLRQEKAKEKLQLYKPLTAK